MMKSQVIQHKGKIIIYADYSDFGADLEALTAEVDAADQWTMSQPPKSVLSVTNVHGSLPTPGALALMQKSATRTNPHIKKQAVIGLTNERAILAKLVTYVSGQELKLFDDLEKAKDWLVAE